MGYVVNLNLEKLSKRNEVLGLIKICVFTKIPYLPMHTYLIVI